MAAGFRDPAALNALYGATHFRSTAPRREPDGFFGAPTAGMLAGGCGVKRNERQSADVMDRCMQALAFAVSPPPRATRAVLLRNLPRISPKDASRSRPLRPTSPWCHRRWRRTRMSRPASPPAIL